MRRAIQIDVFSFLPLPLMGSEREHFRNFYSATINCIFVCGSCESLFKKIRICVKLQRQLKCNLVTQITLSFGLFNFVVKFRDQSARCVAMQMHRFAVTSGDILMVTAVNWSRVVSGQSVVRLVPWPQSLQCIHAQQWRSTVADLVLMPPDNISAFLLIDGSAGEQNPFSLYRSQ